MKRILTITAVVLGILYFVPESVALDKWEEGDIIGTVETVLADGLLIKNVYLKLPDTSIGAGDSYYEYGTNKYARVKETIFIFGSTTGFTANDVVAGSVRYRNMYTPNKVGKGKQSEKIRAFGVFGVLAKLDPVKDLKGPVSVGGRARTFRLYNPITKERETTSDPEAASKYVAKGWMLESATHSPNATGGGAKIFNLYNPVTKARETTSDPEEASKYVAKGWMLESTTHAPKRQNDQD